MYKSLIRLIREKRENTQIMKTKNDISINISREKASQWITQSVVIRILRTIIIMIVKRIIREYYLALVGYSLWAHKDLDTIERLSTLHITSYH